MKYQYYRTDTTINIRDTSKPKQGALEFGVGGPTAAAFVAGLVDEVNAMTDQLTAVRELVRLLEYNERGLCPYCSYRNGHDPECKVGNLLAGWSIAGTMPAEEAGWIPTGETIPQSCTKVLVSYQTVSGMNAKAVAWFDRGLWWLNANHALDRLTEPVNYWMHLPADPA